MGLTEAKVAAAVTTKQAEHRLLALQVTPLSECVERFADGGGSVGLASRKPDGGMQCTCNDASPCVMSLDHGSGLVQLAVSSAWDRYCLQLKLPCLNCGR